MSTLGTWDEAVPLADERFLRRRAITEGLEKNSIPRNKRKSVPILTGSLTKSNSETGLITRRKRTKTQKSGTSSRIEQKNHGLGEAEKATRL
jgi:hypothetical protein